MKLQPCLHTRQSNWSNASCFSPLNEPHVMLPAHSSVTYLHDTLAAADEGAAATSHDL